MDQLRTAHLALQEAVKTVRATESQLKTDNQLLRDESLMLRDKIVQLIKYKSDVCCVLSFFNFGLI